MKKIIHALLLLGMLAALGWTLWTGFTKQSGKGSEEAAHEPAGTPEEPGEKAEEFVLKLEKEQWEALRGETARPKPSQLQPRRVAFGRVIDPKPVIAIDEELSAAAAALLASSAESERTKGLSKLGDYVARKAVESAEAQFRADEIKANGLRRRALAEWGAELAGLSAAERREFADRLVRGDTVLVRVDVLPGDAITETPARARLVVLGRESQPVETQTITPAPDTDPKTQAQGFILQVKQPPFPFRPGMAVTAWLELSEPARPGLAVPRSAILRHDGRTWVYVREGEERFVRKPVILDTPLGEDWFVVPGPGGIEPANELVVTGAESLLSEELKAQGGAEID